MTDFSTSEHEDTVSALALLSAAVSDSGEDSSTAPEASSKAVTKPKSKKAAKTEAVGEVLPPDPVSKAQTEIESLTADEARNMAQQLSNAGEFENFRLGGVFSTVNRNKYFLEYGFEDFKAWVEAEHGIKYRKAMYLLQIYDAVLEFNLKWEEIQHIGWTKLKTLLNPNLTMVTAENIADWVKKAEKLTVMQLEDLLKSKSGDQNAIESDVSGSSTLTFKVHGDQKEVIREALEQIKEQSGTTFDAVALQLMATEYLGKPMVSTAPLPQGAPDATVVIDALTQDTALKDTVFAQLGWMEMLNVIGKIWPTIELSVTVPPDMLPEAGPTNADDL